MHEWRRAAWTLWAFATALLVTIPARAAITFTFAQPQANAVVGVTLNVNVQVTSTYELKTVHAQVETVGADLTAQSGGNPWTGALATGPLSRGAKTLVVTATDLLNNTATASVDFVHDNPPVITVTSPVDGDVASPNAQLTATCSDDDTTVGCKNFQAKIGSTVVASGASAINQSVSFASYDGQSVSVVFSASDSANWTTSVSREVIVDLSPSLVSETVVPGRVVDYDGSRILYRTFGGSMVMRAVGSSTDTVVGSAVGFQVGKLTSAGAFWITLKGSPLQGYGNEWHGGQSTSFHVSSDWAFPWKQEALVPYTRVNGDTAYLGDGPSDTLRDLATGVETPVQWPDYQVCIDAGLCSNGSFFDFALAPNGDVVGIGQDITTNPWTCRVLRWHLGSLIKVADLTGSCDSYPRSPVTDGTTTVFNAKVPTGYQTAMLDPNGNETALSDVRGSYVGPDGYYAVTAGWVAFLKKGVTNVQQIWTRSPSGVLTQVTPFGSDSKIETLDGSGQVMFFNSNRRQFASAGSAPIDVSATFGRSVSLCGAWYVLMGNTVFRVSGVGSDAGASGTCGTTPDAGTDASILDAGSDSSVPGPDGGIGGGGTSSDASAGGDGQGAAGTGGSGASGGTAGSAGQAGVAGAGGSGATGGSPGSAAQGGTGATQSSGTGSGNSAGASGGCGVVGHRSSGSPFGFLAEVSLLGLGLERRRRTAVRNRSRGEA